MTTPGKIVRATGIGAALTPRGNGAAAEFLYPAIPIGSVARPRP